MTAIGLQREGHVKLNFGNSSQILVLSSQPFLPFARRQIRTSSGKGELYSEDLKRQGLDPVVAFIPPTESRHGSQAKTFPLELLARKADNFLNTLSAICR